MIQIIYASQNETIVYAANELKKYLDKITHTLGYAHTEYRDALPKSAGAGEILLGRLSDFSLDESGVKDPTLDDLVDINVKNGSGYIAGSNPRSILFGVYDYFKANGCMWVRPGIGGEHLVDFDPMTVSVTSRKLADVRFRGECLEGSPRYEHLRETVIWAPKVHMNLFMIEQIVPYNYMSCYYRHEGNTLLPNEDIGYDACQALISCLEQDIRRMGLQFHALGHGYQSAPYGIRYETSYQKYEMNSRMENALAMINGERKFFHSPSWSQLCMGNDTVLREQVEWLVEYAKQKPYIDFLHVWLGDNVNNHCECPLCTPHHPSDLYVKMLNMLDEALTEAGLATRIVFISYTDTRWAPCRETIKNPARFVICTAVGNRDYGKPYESDEYPGEVPTWVRNHYDVPNDFRLSRKMFEEWKRAFDGPSFIFEYHFYTDHYHDPGHMELAKNYYKDIHAMPSLGFGGIMNDQTQRCAFPTGFPCMLTGEAQYDLDAPYEALLESYLKAAYGKNWREVGEYLSGLTELFAPKSLRRVGAIDNMSLTEETVDASYYKNDPDASARFEKIPAYVDAFLPTVIAGKSEKDPCHARSYLILEYHAEYCKMLAEVYRLSSMGDTAAAKHYYREVMQPRMSLLEPIIEFEFEMRLFNSFMEKQLQS